MLKCFYYSNYDPNDQYLTHHLIIFAETKELAITELKNQPVDFDPDNLEEIEITAGVNFVDTCGY